MAITVPEAGVGLLILFAVFYWLGIVPALTAIFGFLGVVLLGGSGWLGHILTAFAGWVDHLTDSALIHVIGASAVFALFLGLGAVFLHDLHPRHQTRRRTAWLGIALGVLIVAGLTGIPVLSGVQAGITSAAGSILSAL
jgi:hypothetical protein